MADPGADQGQNRGNELSRQLAESVATLTRELGACELQVVWLSNQLMQATEERAALKRTLRRLFTKSGVFRSAQLDNVVRGALHSMVNDHPDIDLGSQRGIDAASKRIAGQIGAWLKDSL